MNARSLPRMHPRTGLPLVPVGYTRRGPIWPILGASEDDDAGKGGDGGDGGGGGGGGDDKGGDDKSGGDDTGKPDTGDDAGKNADDKPEPDWKARARQHEDRAKKHKATADAALADRTKLAGTLDALRKALDPDGASKDDDPTKVAERAVSERDNALAEARLARVELSAERAARKSGADVDALLDSRQFLDALKQLDPTADTFADDVQLAVDEALKARPGLRASTTPKPPANADMGNGGGKPKGEPTIDERREERRKRRANG